jgi:hypothetical protein
MNTWIIAIDFDGTIVEDRFPEIGDLKPGAVEAINQLYADGYTIIIWTCRTGINKARAVEFLAKAGIKWHYFNESSIANLKLHNFNDTRKVYADLYIDDRGLYRPMPQWKDIYEMIRAYYCPTYADKVGLEGFL